MPHMMPAAPEAPLDLLVVGAGFSGLAMAIRATRDGFDRLMIVEKAASVGGTWRDNTYPGAASDVPAHLYSLSFSPRADWTRLYGRQPEIQAYLRDLVTRHGLAERLRLETSVTALRWDEAAGLWRVETDRGALRARCVACATGGLHRPAVPALPGLGDFAGSTFHSARWDHGCDLAGQRVGVIGTGASAVQLVPEIVERVAHLSLFQRSPAWVLPRRDRPIGARERTLYAALPFLRMLYRQSLFWRREVAALSGFTRVSALTRAGEALAHAHLRRSIPDPDLRRKLTPRYRLGCKRVLISDDYYPALARDNVAVVTESIAVVRPGGIVTADGLEHALDVLIFATGFDIAGSFGSFAVTGRGGDTLADRWRGGMDAFQGITVSGFPNLFLLLGPNTWLGHNSVLQMLEAQVAHVLGALRHLRRHPGQVLDVRSEAQARFRAKVDARMAASIWIGGGCASWYLDAAGRNRVLWPASIPAYRFGAAPMRLADYDTRRLAAG